MNPPERFIEAYTMSANSAGRSNERRTVTPVKGRAGLIATPDGTCTVPLASAIPTPPMVVLLASLALGGAERIVVEWLRAESLRRPIKLVVLHDQPRELRVPPAVTLIRLHGTNLAERLAVFAQALSVDGVSKVVTHLVRDDALEVLWNHDIETIPVIHNTREGWRNDLARLVAGRVPCAIAVADVVARELREAGFAQPILTIRHQVRPTLRALDATTRADLRAGWGVPPDALVIGMIGSFKAQKGYPRAIRVLREVLRHRDAYLVIAGGALGDDGEAAAAATRAQVERLDLHARVIPLGVVDPITPLFTAFDILFNASFHEGLSIATLEALAADLPVVATRVGGQAEIDDPRLVLLDERFDAARAANALLATQLEKSRAALVPVKLIATARLWTLAAAMPTHLRPHRAPASNKVLFVTANLNGGGAQRSLVNLCTALVAHREAAVAVVDASSSAYFTEQLRAAEVTAFRPSESADPFAAAEGLLRWIGAEQPALVCFWNVDPKLKLLLAKYLLPETCKLVDVSPGQYSFIEMDDTRAFQRAIAFDSDAYARRVDATVIKYAASGRDRSHHVIPNGVEAPRRVKSDYTLGSPPRVLVSGRIAPSKRLERIFDATLSLQRRWPTLEVHVYGQAEARHERYLEALLGRWSGRLGATLVMHGARPDALDTLADFDAIVVIGEHQGSPNTVLEALAAGLPVVANASGGTGELIKPRRTGFLVEEAAAPESIARALADALTNRRAAQRMARAGRRLIENRFTIDEMRDEYEALFYRLVRETLIKFGDTSPLPYDRSAEKRLVQRFLW